MLKTKILLIGGSGRSGTSILAKILGQHPDIAKAPEGRFLIDPDGIVDFYANSAANIWSPYHYDLRLARLKRLLESCSQKFKYDKFLRQLDKKRLQHSFERLFLPAYSNVNFSKFDPNFDQHVEELIDELSEFKYRASWVGKAFFSKREMRYLARDADIGEILRRFLLKLMNSVLSKQNKKHYLEKNTWNILWIDKILELLPEAKFVHIYRDPRDVVASYTKQVWMPNSAMQSALIYRDILTRWFEIRKKLTAGTFMEVALEDLVAEPEEKLREICNFSGLDWSANLLKIKLNKAHSGRWQKDIVGEERDKTLAILKKVLQDLKYA